MVFEGVYLNGKRNGKGKEYEYAEKYESTNLKQKWKKFKRC